jgi:phosphonate transport system substrate-binding protein
MKQIVVLEAAASPPVVPKLLRASPGWLLLGVLVLLSGCVREDVRDPIMLRVGVLPDEDAEILRARYFPLLENLAEQTSLTLDLVIPDSYAELLRLFHEREVDLAYFGGYSFVEARERDGAEPLVMRIIDMRFTSLFLVAAGSPAMTVSDFSRKDFAFGSQFSTSGHLMPRHFLAQNGISPETFFKSVRYSGSHDVTAYLVRDGTIDLGVANSTIIRTMYEDGRLLATDVRVLQETPPYANYVWAIHPDLGDDVAFALRDAFLNLSPENEKDQAVLAGLNTTGFVPASPDDFSRLREIVRSINESP